MLTSPRLRSALLRPARLVALSLALVLALGPWAQPASAASGFVDVPPGTAFADDIGWLAEEGISTGWTDDTFRPLSPVNRDAMAAFLHRLSGAPEHSAPATSPFSDVTPETPFYREITWLASTGISTGWDDDTFRPLLPVARDAMAAFMRRWDESVGVTSLGWPTGLAGFDPGMIISDESFYDPDALSGTAIATFLTNANPNCLANPDDGTPCLKDYRGSIPEMPATAYCSAVAARTDASAAEMVAEVSRACGINPQVLIVLLQKEQGFVTASGTALTPTKYARATGAGCPDFTSCDGSLADFFRQVYGAGEKFRKYRALPAGYNVQAGRTNTIQYHPEPTCGSATVYIENQATAGLYTYTPYAPNAEAIAVGTGAGDLCSAYGNRNFYYHMQRWFPQALGGSDADPIAPNPGSTITPALRAVLDKAAGYGASRLGSSTGPMSCNQAEGGCVKPYAQARVYWSDPTGAHVTRGGLQAAWLDSYGGPGGSLGYPVSDESCDAGATRCSQDFQRGTLVWTDGGGITLEQVTTAVAG